MPPPVLTLLHNEDIFSMAVDQSQWLSAILLFFKFTWNVSQTELSLSLHQWPSEVCLLLFYSPIGDRLVDFTWNQKLTEEPINAFDSHLIQ